MTDLPLEGIRVLDLSRWLPGPYGTLFLADFGADVIRVEDTAEGDPYRQLKPLVQGHGARHLMLNRNKRGVGINLKDPRGREAFWRLADTAHVVFDQFRPGVAARLGIDYETLAARNPRLVYCSLSGFGQDGPYRDVVAHDPVYQGLAGIVSLMGRPGGSPIYPPVCMADITSGLMSALAIVIALRHAERTGQGQYIDLSLYDTVLSTLVTPASLALFTGRGPRQGEERHAGRYPCSAVYETSDGRYIVFCATENHFWANLCRFFCREDFIDHQWDDGPKREEMFTFFREAFKARSQDEWVRLLWDRQVAFGPVRTIDEAFSDEHIRHRQMVTHVETPGVGTTPQIGLPIKLSSTPGSIRHGAPLHGQHTEDLLLEVGYSAQEIEVDGAGGSDQGPRT